MSDLYPWLEELWHKWQNSLGSDQFSNVSLLNAPLGLGGDKLVEQLAKALMCTKDKVSPCGLCHSCDLMASGTHPDFHLFKPEKEGKAITVDQIRLCNKFAQESSQLSHHRLIVIESAHSLNESAANALLKTLESSSQQCFFVLLTDRLNLLLPTIVSRCQQWSLPVPTAIEVTEWVEQQIGQDCPLFVAHICNYEPLQAKQFIEQDWLSDYRKLEEQFLLYAHGEDNWIELTSLIAQQAMLSMTWLWYLISDAQKIHFDVCDPQLTPGSVKLCELLSYDKLYQMGSTLGQLRRQLETNSGLNVELLTADWLIQHKEEPCS
ncbi:DNA polymerase III subunit delta' C-terminal domain-containing protein [Vibrio marisflavi]|uniref:DNA polymerase III subunit delta' n=1 Tax=Vibrio marisflavi CECT 7928 TaxID=634439 RepID=A0ABM9A3F6_9VIBR|nr:DNA polymerase III subunit delta' C-terminal domain-containing protein [Vibrio marisflavi]CAH0539253.1 DNA polymerase III subunit delta' [Vibrio marisflavi CECT 7928]